MAHRTRSLLALAGLAVGTASLAPQALAHAGPANHKACGSFAQTSSVAKTHTLQMLFPNYINPRVDVFYLRLTAVLPTQSGNVDPPYPEPSHSYNLFLNQSHWFPSNARSHRGGWVSVSFRVRPVVGRQTSLGGTIYVPQAVSRCQWG
jgi:hypothetical protein